MAEYYRAYDARYRATFDAGIDIWGHSEADLKETLGRWVEENNLQGKRVVEFACGECSSGLILSHLGCRYLGADVSPFVVKRAKERLKDYPGAELICMDLVKETPMGEFDAALDISGLHMLVTDEHRRKYLSNMRRCLIMGAPVLFHAEAFREDFPEYAIESLEQWAGIVNIDFSTPQERELNGRTVMLPTLPARPLSLKGYEKELSNAGFSMEKFTPMNMHDGIFLAAHIRARAI